MRLWRDRTIRARVKLGALLAFLLLVASAQDSREDCCINPEDGQKEPKFYHYTVTASPTVVYLTVGESKPVTVTATCSGEPGCLNAAMPLRVGYPKDLAVSGTLGTSPTTLTVTAPLPTAVQSTTGNLADGPGNWYKVTVGLANAPAQFAGLDRAVIDVWVQSAPGPLKPPPTTQETKGAHLYLQQMMKADQGAHWEQVAVGTSSDFYGSVANAGGEDLVIYQCEIIPRIRPESGSYAMLASPPFVIGPSGSLNVPIRFTAKALPTLRTREATRPADRTGDCVSELKIYSNAEKATPGSSLYLRAFIGPATPAGAGAGLSEAQERPRVP